jgi:nitrogen regulatory protein P-II 1
MKQINAYIQPFMADKVTDALRIAGIHGVTVVPCKGFGRMVQAPGMRYEDASDTLGFVNKTKLEIVCAAADQDRILATIREHAHTGRHGDGKIFVSTVDEAEDIRTGAKGRDVI